MTHIEPFRIEVAPAAIGDLRRRLRATRWPAGVTDSGGIPLDEVRALVEYWVDGFDWEARERAVNELPQFRAGEPGSRLHFIHLPAAAPAAPALLLLHGWPGSFVEFLDVLPRLREYHLVVPSLPGYGFSDAPAAPGMSSRRIAGRMAELMTALGYERFAAQGGDWGAGVATWLALDHADRVAGIHLNYVPLSLAPAPGTRLTEAEEAFRLDDARWVAEFGAYGALQATRPLTLAYGLTDSPAGLAAWIVEKFREWAAPTSDISIDALLTNVMVYWATASIGPSMRLYLEAARERFPPGTRVAVPCAIARFPYEEPFPPRVQVERHFDVRRWTDMPRGGHFAAMEEPALLADDVAAFMATLR